MLLILRYRSHGTWKRKIKFDFENHGKGKTHSNAILLSLATFIGFVKLLHDISHTNL